MSCLGAQRRSKTHRTRARSQDATSSTFAPSAARCTASQPHIAADFSFVRLAGRYDLTVAGLETEPELARTVLRRPRICQPRERSRAIRLRGRDRRGVHDRGCVNPPTPALSTQPRRIRQEWSITAHWASVTSEGYRHTRRRGQPTAPGLVGNLGGFKLLRGEIATELLVGRRRDIARSIKSSPLTSGDTPNQDQFRNRLSNPKPAPGATVAMCGGLGTVSVRPWPSAERWPDRAQPCVFRSARAGRHPARSRYCATRSRPARQPPRRP